jgi:hypothetical protein
VLGVLCLSIGYAVGKQTAVCYHLLPELRY